jgi:hypothetical protein
MADQDQEMEDVDNVQEEEVDLDTRGFTIRVVSLPLFGNICVLSCAS